MDVRMVSKFESDANTSMQPIPLKTPLNGYIW